MVSGFFQDEIGSSFVHCFCLIKNINASPSRDPRYWRNSPSLTLVERIEHICLEIIKINMEIHLISYW